MCTFAWFKEFDDTGNIFPIWGTCLGFEVLFMLTKGSAAIMDSCNSYDYATSLTFMPGILIGFGYFPIILWFFYSITEAAESRLLGSSLPAGVKNALENEATTSNFHNYCMRPKVRICFLVLKISLCDVMFISILCSIF